MSFACAAAGAKFVGNTLIMVNLVLLLVWDGGSSNSLKTRVCLGKRFLYKGCRMLKRVQAVGLIKYII